MSPALACRVQRFCADVPRTEASGRLVVLRAPPHPLANAARQLQCGVCVCVCVIWFCKAVSTRGLSISDIGCHVAAALGLHMFGQSNPCVMAWQSDGNATSSAAAEGKVGPISGLEKWSVFGKVRPDSGHKNEASFTKNLHKI